MKAPYASTISVMRSLAQVKSLPKFKEALKYAWSKVQTEAARYWKGKQIDVSKTFLSEDARLMAISFILIQAASYCRDLVPMLYAVQSFVNE